MFRTLSWVIGKCCGKLVNGEGFVMQKKEDEADNTHEILMQTKLLSGGLERINLGGIKD